MSTAERTSSPRERLLQAARDVAASEGLEGLTLRAIARRAGVSHGAPLRHFPTLAALLAAVAADGFARLIAAVDAALAEADEVAAARGDRLGARQRLAAAGHAYVRFALADPGVFTVTFRPERVDVTDAGYQHHGMASFRQLVDLVEAAQAEGWQAGERPEVLAAAVWAHVHGVAELTLHGALPGVVGDGAAGRVLALSTALTLGIDPAGVPVLDPSDPLTPSLEGDSA
ncbi:MAG TPA: TetR/AcrR family transcriptional regulator [Acidimicrobiales bacterium]|nr:TetR/AcrR family transcriptional regulator [Acidimicrobiales bacterium]